MMDEKGGGSLVSFLFLCSGYIKEFLLYVIVRL